MKSLVHKLTTTREDDIQFPHLPSEWKDKHDGSKLKIVMCVCVCVFVIASFDLIFDV